MIILNHYLVQLHDATSPRLDRQETDFHDSQNRARLHSLTLRR